MSPSVFKIIHLTGVLMIFLSLGGLIVRGQLGESGDRIRKLAGMTNGVGLLLALIGGFGLLGATGAGFPGWAMAKFVIWIIFGGLAALVNRKPGWGKWIWWMALLLGIMAAFLAGFKPF